MSQTVTIVCRECHGSGNGPDGFCGWCLAQGHECVDRVNGGVPEGCTEWIPATLPPAPVVESPPLRGIPCQ